MVDFIKKLILSCGADVCGIANIKRFESAPKGFSPIDIYKDCQSVIVFGKALTKGLTQIDSRIIYGYYNSFICSEVDRIALNGAKLLEIQCNAIAVPIPCDSPYEYSRYKVHNKAIARNSNDNRVGGIQNSLILKLCEGSKDSYLYNRRFTIRR